MTDTEITQADRDRAHEFALLPPRWVYEMLAKHRLTARNEALAEAAKVAEDEMVDADATGDETDAAYNRGIEDAITAIRALTASQGGEEGQGHSATQNDANALRGAFPGDLEGIDDGT